MIDRASPIPIYHQLKTLIREQITSGLWRPGDRIPSEGDLCQQYGISRAPVRQALADLATEGLLVRRPGVGSFVDHSPAKPVAPDSDIRCVIMEHSRWSSILTEISAVWNSTHPSRPVRIRAETFPHSIFHDRLTAAIGSGTAPDLAVLDSVWVAGLARAGFLYALEDLQMPANSFSFARDAHQAVLQANSYDGRLYAVPATVDAALLWYRRDWFTAEGLAPPQNWNELVSTSRHFLQRRVRERYGLTHPLAMPTGTAGGEATVYTLLPFIWSAGGDVCGPTTANLDSPGTRLALHFLRELVAVHGIVPAQAVSYRADTAPQLFAHGRVAMALGGSYEAANLREWSRWHGDEFAERVGCVPVPPAPGTAPVATLGGVSYVVLRQCARPTLMLELLQISMDPMVIGGVYRSALLASAGAPLDTSLPSGSELPLDVIRPMLAAGRGRPCVPEYVKVSRQLQAMFEAVFFTSMPVEDIVRRTAEFIGVICEYPCQATQAPDDRGAPQQGEGRTGRVQASRFAPSANRQL